MIVVLTGALTLLACGDGGGGDRPPLPGLGGAGAGGGGGGTAMTGPCPQATTVNGIATPYPHIAVALTPSQFEARSLNFNITEDGDPRGPLSQILVEVENVDSVPHCDFLPTAILGQFEFLIVSLVTPAHYDEFEITAACVMPGEIGVIEGIVRGVTEQDLQTASLVTVDVEPADFTSPFPITNGPALGNEQIVRTAGGWALAGDVQVDAEIYNYALNVYPRTKGGALAAELRAFPGELDPLPAGSTHTFETEASPCEFSDYDAYQSWIVR